MTTEQPDDAYLSWSLSTTSSAVQDFADRLRDEKYRAEATFREIAAHAYRNHSQMVRAAKGNVLPTWEVTQAFLLACGVARHNLGPWRQFWVATRNFLAAEQLLRRAGTELSVDSSVARRGSRMLTRKDWVEVMEANTPAQLGLALRHLLEHNGLPSIRQAAEATGVPKSTLSDWLEGKRVPSADRLDQLLQRVGASQTAQQQFAACLERIRERRWSPSAVEQLKELYPRLSGSALVLKLGRSHAAIREKVEELALPPRPTAAS